MAEVQNIGAVDYNQFQPAQLQTVPEENMANMPEVYDEHVEQKRAAGRGMVGATILGATMLVVGGLIGKKMGSKGLEEVKQTAEAAKQRAEEAVKKYEKIQEATNEIGKVIEENNNKGFFKKYFSVDSMKNKIMEIIKPFKKEAAAVEEKAAEGAAKAGEKAEDTAKK